MKITGTSTNGTVNYMVKPHSWNWGRKSILTLIALLASIGLAFYLKWSAGGVTLVFGTLLGLHHTANVAESKLK